MSEFVDLYDSNRQKLNRTKERTAPLNEGEYTTVVHALLINDNGEILVQKRVPTKKKWPDLWDISCSGALIAGETSQEGLEREVEEELGLKIDLTNVLPTLTASYSGGFSDYYILSSNATLEDIVIEPKEITDVKWISFDTLFSWMADGFFIPYDQHFIKALLALYENKSEIHVI